MLYYCDVLAREIFKAAGVWFLCLSMVITFRVLQSGISWPYIFWEMFSACVGFASPEWTSRWDSSVFKWGVKFVMCLNLDTGSYWLWVGVLKGDMLDGLSIIPSTSISSHIPLASPTSPHLPLFLLQNHSIMLRRPQTSHLHPVSNPLRDLYPIPLHFDILKHLFPQVRDDGTVPYAFDARDHILQDRDTTDPKGVPGS